MRNFSLFSLLLISLLCLTGVGSSCRRHDTTHDSKLAQQMLNMRIEATDAALKDDFGTADSIGKALQRLASDVGDDVNAAYGLLSQGYYTKTQLHLNERLEKVRQAEKLALTTDNDTLLSRIYNTLGSYAAIAEGDFSLAKHYYTEAIRYAQHCGMRNLVVAWECNLAELYHIFEDTLGLKYDLDIYDYATKEESKPLVIASAKRIAEYHISRRGESALALPYIQSLRDAGSDYQANVVTAKYHIATDSLDTALHDLEAAARSAVQTPDLYLTRALLFNRMKRYEESNRSLDIAHAALAELNDKGKAHLTLWRLYADNYRHLDDPRATLRYQDLYIAARDSINELRNQEEINSYKVKFDVQKKELELAKQKEIIRWQGATLWVVLGSGALIGVFWLFYRRRRKGMQRLIVRQQKDFIRQQEAVAAEPAAPGAPESDTGDRTGLSDEKTDAIWAMIMHEMEANRIFTDTTVTRDLFAQRIGCNHTWFSQVIKEKTGKSYPSFMNSYRIGEAVKILSKAGAVPSQKDIAASLGFISVSTYYSTFKQQMGMSPADYRRLAMAEPQDSAEET